jgi:hypothetical protein
MSSICPSAERRSSAISWASTCGSGRVAESSRLSSRSQKMSSEHLSRATISSYVYGRQRPSGFSSDQVAFLRPRFPSW